jgi:hypothetical protein
MTCYRNREDSSRKKCLKLYIFVFVKKTNSFFMFDLHSVFQSISSWLSIFLSFFSSLFLSHSLSLSLSLSLSISISLSLFLSLSFYLSVTISPYFYLFLYLFPSPSFFFLSNPSLVFSLHTPSQIIVSHVLLKREIQDWTSESERRYAFVNCSFFTFKQFYNQTWF